MKLALEHSNIALNRGYPTYPSADASTLGKSGVQ